MSTRTDKLMELAASPARIPNAALLTLASAVSDIADQMENFTEVFSRIPVADVASAIGDIANQMENFSENLAWAISAHTDAIQRVGAVIDEKGMT